MCLKSGSVVNIDTNDSNRASCIENVGYSDTVIHVHIRGTCIYICAKYEASGAHDVFIMGANKKTLLAVKMRL